VSTIEITLTAETKSKEDAPIIWLNLLASNRLKPACELVNDICSSWEPQLVAKLYGISDEELEEIKKTLRILKEGKVEEES